MGSENKYLRAGVLVICGALLLRLVSSGAVASFVTKPEVITTLLLLETGRYVPAVEERIPETDPVQTAPTEPTTAPTEPIAVPKPVTAASFSPSDAKLVTVNNVCGYDVDLQAMLEKPLSWDLTEGGPAVLIVHTHGTESYEKTEDYTESSAYRTLNTDYNMISIGKELQQILQSGGIRVIHDTTMHDQPSYSASYSQSRKSIKAYLQEYPSICFVLDLHRDAVENNKGKQVSFTAEYQGNTAAQLMLVVGTDVNLSHPDWPENMSLAVKLHAQLERDFPGICRPISLRSQRFNQDLSPGALLVEVGAAGNTRQEALLAAELLAQGILALANGAVTIDSTNEGSGLLLQPG